MVRSICVHPLVVQQLTFSFSSPIEKLAFYFCSINGTEISEVCHEIHNVEIKKKYNRIDYMVFYNI